MQVYEERLAAPAGWWLITVLMAAGVGVVFLRLGVAWALGALGVALVVLGGSLTAFGRIRIRVDEELLAAGTARIPLSAVGAVTPLDAEAARRLRGVDADPRAFLVLRGYVAEAVRVDIADPDDPTPYIYLSTRRPAQLAHVLAARTSRAPRMGVTAERTRHEPASPEDRGELGRAPDAHGTSVELSGESAAETARPAHRPPDR